jgi:hypothetical protein
MLDAGAVADLDTPPNPTPAPDDGIHANSGLFTDRRELIDLTIFRQVRVRMNAACAMHNHANFTPAGK